MPKRQTGPEPPRSLGPSGLVLWRSIHAQYQIGDAGGIEILASACAALDRAENLRARIDADGEIVQTHQGPKDHPGLKHELANRAFVVRALARLGLDVEAIRPVGRPGQAVGILR